MCDFFASQVFFGYNTPIFGVTWGKVGSFLDPFNTVDGSTIRGAPVGMVNIPWFIGLVIYGSYRYTYHIYIYRNWFARFLNHQPYHLKISPLKFHISFPAMSALWAKGFWDSTQKPSGKFCWLNVPVICGTCHPLPCSCAVICMSRALLEDHDIWFQPFYLQHPAVMSLIRHLSSSMKQLLKHHPKTRENPVS